MGVFAIHLSREWVIIYGKIAQLAKALKCVLRNGLNLVMLEVYLFETWHGLENVSRQGLQIIETEINYFERRQMFEVENRHCGEARFGDPQRVQSRKTSEIPNLLQSRAG